MDGSRNHRGGRKYACVRVAAVHRVEDADVRRNDVIFSALLTTNPIDRSSCLFLLGKFCEFRLADLRTTLGTYSTVKLVCMYVFCILASFLLHRTADPASDGKYVLSFVFNSAISCGRKRRRSKFLLLQLPPFKSSSSRGAVQPTMKARLTFVPLFAVALAWPCNAYATPGGVANRGARKIQSSRPSIIPRAADSSGAYDLKRYIPLERNPVPAESNETGVSNNDAGGSKVAAKKIGGAVSSLVVVALALMTSTASRRLISDYLLSLLASYESTMVRYPRETKVATGAFLAVLGDALAQTREPGQTSYNPRRAASFAAFDSCYRLFQHNAFPFIISICQGRVLGGLLATLPGVVVGNNLRLGLAALERTLAYQLVVIPLLYYPIFFAFTGYLQGLKPQQILQRAKTSFLPCWKRNLMFWIPTQMVMFGLIDDKWQIPFACVMGMLWSTILSVTAGNAKAGSKKE